MMQKTKGRTSLGPRLITMGRHLVYSEGTKTEPLYVENIKSHIPEDPTHANVLVAKKYSKSKHTTELLERAELAVRKERENKHTVDDVWIFLDKDSFGDFDEACRSIEKKNTTVDSNGEARDMLGTRSHCCYSNQCFELWVYLHFNDLHSKIGREKYIEKINSFIARINPKETYTKNKETLYDFLPTVGGNVDKAIKLAKKLDIEYGVNREEPSTKVYEFVEFFRKYME